MVDFKKKRREPMTQEDVIENKRQDPTVQRDWVNACLHDDIRHKLTEKELGFLRSVRRQLSFRRRTYGTTVEVVGGYLCRKNELRRLRPDPERYV